MSVFAKKIDAEAVIRAYRVAHSETPDADIIDRAVHIGIDKFLAELASEFRGLDGIRILDAVKARRAA